MEIRENAERVTRQIGGVEVSVAKPFAEGDVLTAATAAMLNQTFLENVGNNTRSRIEKFKDGESVRVATADEAQSIIDTYVAAYEPGVRQGGGGGAGAAKLTPLQREVRALATDILLGALKNAGKKRGDVDFNALRDQFIEQRNDELEAKAKKILKARETAQAGDADLLAGIDIGAAASGEGEGATEEAGG
jgi:hypothetical protein